MEKVIEGVKSIKTSLLRKAWLNISLFVLAMVLIGSGLYLNSYYKGTKSAAVIDYNQGLSDYNSTEYIPASGLNPPVYEVANVLKVVGSFQQAASESTDNILKSLALYNIGTLIGRDYLVFAVERTPGLGLTEAISKLEEAVRMNPDDEDAKYNLEFLERLLILKK